MEREYNSKLTKIILCIRARKIVVQGFLVSLAQVKDDKVESPSIDFIPIVFEFKEVFLIMFSGIPLDRDIDFCIDLEFYTRPIFIPPYHMALVE